MTRHINLICKEIGLTYQQIISTYDIITTLLTSMVLVKKYLKQRRCNFVFDFKYIFL